MTRLASMLVCAFLGLAAGCSSPQRPEYVSTPAGIEPGQQLENAARWQDDAVIYQVWIKGFADGVYGDQIGDLPGLKARLGHLQDLGVNTIWLSPVFECDYKGSNMHGYDTTDYYQVNNRFGTKADLKAVLDDAHARGIRVLFDFVPNHTSTKHPWFTGAATRDSWYVWKPSIPAGWGLPWGGGSSSEVWRDGDAGYFYTAFSVDSLADLNWYNPATRAEMYNVARFWLDRGFDGMRIDAVRYLCESGPGQQADTADTHAALKGLRAVLDEYATGTGHPHPNGDPAKVSHKIMIAEAWTEPEAIAPYYGNGSDEFHMCFDFTGPGLAHRAVNGDAAPLLAHWARLQTLNPAGARVASFDSNHDNVISRPGTRYPGAPRKVILAEALNILGPGSPVIYYGNEVGMPGAAGNDVDLRGNLDWGVVADQKAKGDSILSWCRYLIQARSAYPALRGEVAALATDVGPTKAIAYMKTAGAAKAIVVANLTASAQTVNLTDLASKGLATGAAIQAILGSTKNNNSFNGTAYPVLDLPAHGVRVLHAGGDSFKGTIHGDIQ